MYVILVKEMSSPQEYVSYRMSSIVGHLKFLMKIIVAILMWMTIFIHRMITRFNNVGTN